MGSVEDEALLVRGMLVSVWCWVVHLQLRSKLFVERRLSWLARDIHVSLVLPPVPFRCVLDTRSCGFSTVALLVQHQTQDMFECGQHVVVQHVSECKLVVMRSLQTAAPIVVILLGSPHGQQPGFKRASGGRRLTVCIRKTPA